MTHLGYLIAGWSIALGSLALYSVRIIARGRQLGASVPVDRRRWMTAEGDS